MTDLPAIGTSTACDGLGSITRMTDLNFLAETLDGKRYVSHNCRRADVSFRTALNYLRKRAGLPTLPKMCSVCAKDIPDTCSYCSNACRDARKGFLSAANDDRSSSGIGVLRRAQQAALARPEARSNGIQPVTSNGNYSADEVRDLRAARLQADAMIRQRGGIAPRGYDGYLRDLRGEK